MFFLLQSLYQEAAAADRHESYPEELCCLPETQKLAVVEAFHQGELLMTDFSNGCKKGICPFV